MPWRVLSVLWCGFSVSACALDVTPIFVDAEYYYSKYLLWFWLPLILMFFQGLAIVILWINVGQRKRIEAHLNIFHKALEQCPAAVVVVNRDFRVEFVNYAYCSESALTESQAVGESLFGLRGFPFTQEECLKHLASDATDQAWRVEALCRWQDGSLRHHRFVMSLVRDVTGEVCHYVVLRENIDAQKRAEAQLVFQANYDVLTELPNRALLIARMREAIKQCDWYKRQIAVLFLDLNGFKKVNDQFGHAFGDRLLTQVAHRLLASVGREGLIARMGGDEFVILMELHDTVQVVGQLAERTIEHLQSPFRQDGKMCFLSASVGIAMYPDDAQQPETLLQYADLAMYASKVSSRGGYLFYQEEMNQQAQRRAIIETGLRQAIDKAEMFLMFQPVVDCDQRLRSCEVLVRWQQSACAISPNEFVPVAEQSGDIQRIGAWVMREACRHYQQWMEKRLAPPQIAVNVSFCQLQHGAIVELVEQCLTEFPAVAGHLTLEMTERVFIDDMDHTNEVFSALKRLGCRLAIDDFG
ncbi:MAG: diguanylate cyclase, partial [Gammaproteobacteria bacterium]